MSPTPTLSLSHPLSVIMAPHHNDERDGPPRALTRHDQVASSLWPAVSAIGIIPKPASLGGHMSYTALNV